ncbi:MAG: SRPBCC family protein [Chloroflexi bacterium]|nr:SRPBCC family protein [Chloroflexota bacterium]
MIRYSSEVTINRPPRAVYEALLDPDRYAQWTPMSDMAFDDDGPRRVGQRGHFRMNEGPIKGRLEMEIVELEPDRKVSVRVKHSNLDWLAVNTIQPEGSGSRLTYAGELSLRGALRLMEPFMRGEVERGEAAEARKLKALLEAEAVPATTA